MTETVSELHILNGDLALKLWERCNFQAPSLVWRETYLEGPLPATPNLHLFRKARANYLATFAELAAIDEKRLYGYLQKQDDAILDLPENATVMLWFDACIFDQTILMRILSLLQTKSNSSINVFLYCCNSNCLTANDFQTGIKKRIRLTPQDWQLAGQAWKLFLNRNAEGMMQLAESGNFDHMPAMQKALLRCAEEVPGSDGLNRTQRQILQLAASGSCSFMEIFKGLSNFEEYPFLGDTACQRNLDLLIENGWLTLKNNGYFLNDQKLHERTCEK